MAGMTRQQMKETIEAGNSVSHGGRIIRHVDDLPSEEDVAVSSQEKQAALDKLEQEHEQLSKRIDTLKDEIATTKEREAEADKVAAERRELDKRAVAAGQSGQPAGAPLNPVTAHGAGAPAVPTRKAGEREDDEDEEPLNQTFAGRKLSFYRDKLNKSEAKSEAEQKKVLSELDGVGDATAAKILEALDEVGD